MQPRSTRKREPIAELPELDADITLVDVDEELGVTPVQTLVIDRLLVDGGDAVWVDGANRAKTARLRELAPHPRYLDRVTVGRGFTPYQHTSLVDRLAGRLESTPGVVVATSVDRLYRSDDLATERGTEMLVRTIAALARVGRVHDVPVIVTRVREDEFSAPLANAAKTRLRCRKTAFGPRFEDPDTGTETLVYHSGDGWVQTTLAYWQEVLEHRVRMHEQAAVSQPISAVSNPS